MDISGMFPALDIPECAKIAADMWYKSGMELNLDTEELGLYLALTVDRARLEELGLADFCHARIKTRGAHPGITTKEVLNRDSKARSLFHKPTKLPSEDQARVMFKVAFEIMIKVCMQEHLYSFNGELRKQRRGGAIGNVLTGALATIFMISWCKLFLEKVTEATRDIPEFVIHLLKVYVDDENVACEALPPGSKQICQWKGYCAWSNQR